MLQQSYVHLPPALLLPPCRSSEMDYSTCRNKKHVTAADHLSLSFYLILHFPFLSLSVWKISQRWIKRIRQNKQENSSVFGWNRPASFRPRMTHTEPSLSPKCVPVFILCLLSTFLTTIYIFPPKKITASIQKSEVQVDGWKSKCREAVWSTVTSRRRAWLRTLYYLSEYKIEHTDMHSCLIAKKKKSREAGPRLLYFQINLTSVCAALH